MRRVFMALTMLLSLSAFGQEIKFMGLSLGTDVEVFSKALKSKGLKQTIDRFERKEFEGTFATYPGCRIIVCATEVSKKVKTVEVIFESVRNDEYERDKAFDAILEQYKSKYGSKLTKKTQSNADNFLGLTTYQVQDGDVKIDLHKTGPSALSPEQCSMSISYISTSLTKIKETNPNKHSSDI